MRVLSIVHEPDAGAGVFGAAAAEAGHELVKWVPARGARPALDGLGAAFVFGGAMNVHDEAEHVWLASEKALIGELLAARTPLLGVCLGGQLVSAVAGARVRRTAEPEIGWHNVRLTSAGLGDSVLGGLPARFDAFEWHSYEFGLPAGALALAHSRSCLQAWRLGGHAWAIQFHAEVTEASVGAWAADYRSDSDAVAMALDPAALIAQTAGKIATWNAHGHELARRFLAAAASA